MYTYELGISFHANFISKEKTHKSIGFLVNEMHAVVSKGSILMSASSLKFSTNNGLMDGEKGG